MPIANLSKLSQIHSYALRNHLMRFAAMHKNQPSQYQKNPVDLSFKDKSLEHEFRSEHAINTLSQIRTALIIAAILYALFSILDFLVMQTGHIWALLVRFLIAIPIFLLCCALTYKAYFRTRLQLLVSATIYVAGMGLAWIAIFYQDSQNGLYLTGTLLPIFWAFLYSGLRFIQAVKVSLALIVSYDILFYLADNLSQAIFVSFNFFLITSTIIGILGGYTIERYYRRDFVNRRIIDAERLKNEQLLLNILPKNIVSELKQHPGTIAKDYEQITVLFADLVEFSKLSLNHSAHQVVTILNEIFSLFDHLTDKYGLEKIKTIGDAYMVTNNLLDGSESSAKSVAEFAVAMRDALQQYNQEKNYNIQIRIGIHTGPAVAGVIGIKKFIYDVWGNTVNIASRMESTCPSNQIQLSEYTYQILKDEFDFENCGEIKLKGICNMHAYLLSNKKAEVSGL